MSDPTANFLLVARGVVQLATKALVALQSFGVGTPETWGVSGVSFYDLFLEAQNGQRKVMKWK